MKTENRMKEKAVRLRVSERLSNREIARRLDVPYPTVADWVRGHPLSDDERRGKISLYAKKPNPEFMERTHLSKKDEKIKWFGLGLYAGEGSKTGNSVGLNNSNPKIISAFLKFLRVIFHVNENRLRANLQIKDCQREEKLVSYWSRVTKIPKRQFRKTIITKANPYKNNKRYMGTCSVRYSDQTLLKRILDLIGEIGD